MGRKATKELYVRPETKQLFLEQKPEGESQDRYLRRLMGVAEQ